jgi:myo-inositol-1(or 4)-monophosphatase
VAAVSGKSETMPSFEDWREAFRRTVSAHRELFAGTPGIEARTVYEGVGEGGDRTLEIDRRAEDVVFEELAALHEAGAEFTAVSEERGEVAFGDGSSAWRVVIDPIDGSLNARRTIPSHSLSVAIASGSSLADVEYAFVHDFGAGEEFSADHHRGAWLDDEPLLARGPGYGLELVGLEASKPELIAPIIDGLAGKAFRVRSLGSLAISLCYVAAGRFDGLVSARPTRSVDIAAAQLIAREAGAVVKFDPYDLDGAHLGLEARYEVVGALDEELLGTLLAIQRGAVAQRA